jgi:hypothetical protein
LTSVGSNISSMYGLLPESFFISFSAADIDGLRCDYCPHVQCSQCMLHCILIINIRQMIVGFIARFLSHHILMTTPKWDANEHIISHALTSIHTHSERNVKIF